MPRVEGFDDMMAAVYGFAGCSVPVTAPLPDRIACC